MSRIFRVLAVFGMCGSFAVAQGTGPALTPIPPSVQAPGTGNNPAPMPDTVKPSPLLNPAQNHPNKQRSTTNRTAQPVRIQTADQPCELHNQMFNRISRRLRGITKITTRSKQNVPDSLEPGTLRLNSPPPKSALNHRTPWVEDVRMAQMGYREHLPLMRSNLISLSPRLVRRDSRRPPVFQFLLKDEQFLSNSFHLVN